MSSSKEGSKLGIKGEAVGKQSDVLALSLQPAGICGSQNTHVASTEPKHGGLRVEWSGLSVPLLLLFLL